jgi:hypothetical protein
MERRCQSSGELADFGHDRHRRDLRDSAQCLERLDHRAHPFGRGVDRLVNRALESCQAIRGVLDFVEIIQQGGLLRGVRVGAGEDGDRVKTDRREGPRPHTSPPGRSAANKSHTQWDPPRSRRQFGCRARSRQPDDETGTAASGVPQHRHLPRRARWRAHHLFDRPRALQRDAWRRSPKWLRRG